MKTESKIQNFVRIWIESQEPDTFIRNEHGVLLFTSGAVTINIESYFQDLLEEFYKELQIEN